MISLFVYFLQMKSFNHVYINISNGRSYLEHRKPAWEGAEHETPLRPWRRNPPSWVSSTPCLSFCKEECKKCFYATDED